MIKKIGLAGMGLLLISIALGGCAPVQKTMITTNNLSVLKGTWQGWASFGIGQGAGKLTHLVIKNDSVPVQGSVTFDNLPREFARVVPADNKTAGNDVTFNFSEGEITNQGTVLAKTGQDVLELTYFAGEKPKIQGWFQFWGVKGTFEVSRQ